MTHVDGNVPHVCWLVIPHISILSPSTCGYSLPAGLAQHCQRGGRRPTYLQAAERWAKAKKYVLLFVNPKYKQVVMVSFSQNLFSRIPMAWQGLYFANLKTHLADLNLGYPRNGMICDDLLQQSSTKGQTSESIWAYYTHIYIWVWVNTYRYIFSGMNIHLPAILGFTRYQGFDPSPYI